MSERPRLKDLDSGVPDWTQYHFATIFYMDEIEAENTRLLLHTSNAATKLAEVVAENKLLLNGFTGALVAADVRARTITLSVPFSAFREGEVVTGRQYLISASALKATRHG